MNLELFVLLQLTENVLSKDNKYFGFKTKNFKRKDIFSKNNYVLETHTLFQAYPELLYFSFSCRSPPTLEFPWNLISSTSLVTDKSKLCLADPMRPKFTSGDDNSGKQQFHFHTA